jgi:hypothetical protein
VKLSSADVAMVFEYLDKNSDSFISYNEFCFLCEEKRRGIDPFDNNQSIQKNHKQLNQTTVVEDEDDKLERMSMASNFYQGFKSKRLRSKHQFGK